RDWLTVRERLVGPPILVDGAMGTELYQRGVYVNRCYDELNLTQPDLVGSVHADYLKAGATIIETNTYGAATFKLTPHNLAQKVREINRAGVAIARAAVERSGREGYVCGSIGPLGRRLAPLGTLTAGEAEAAYREQAEGLLDGGVDLISVETIIDPAELTAAVRAVRSLSADVPLLAQFTLADWDQSAYGATIEQMAEVLNALPVDAIGFNCSLGPAKLLDAARQLLAQTSKPVSLMPNAGELEWVEGRLICRATPEYFAEYAKRMVQEGVRIIGGCCGSTPAHIRAMDAALRAVVPELARVKVPEVVVPVAAPRAEAEKVAYEDLSPLARALATGQFVWSVEINPPRSPVVGKIVERVRDLRARGVTAVNVPDGPRASARLSAMVLASIVRRETGIDAILHYTCRDRNILGMQSDLLGAEALGLDNILCITGDPPKLGDYPMATAVFDVDAIGLLKIADNLNHALDLAGNPIPRGTTFHLGCGANPGASDPGYEIERLHRKMAAGARFIMTQPVFDVELFFAFLDRLNRPDVPVLVGILPLVSYRNAEFYHNEVPGMQVPQAIRDRLRRIDDKDQAAAAGVEIAREALRVCADRARGAYIMPPFGKTELALEVMGE
ncbi:MAG: bifunctional homocysteine S-methyltransferase/methylenetetrahydrofolate reductase, partial [Calditrichaeota bacterium]|nr:bifunctional homocysteine S-methyltransferase/methylenetetrahydrofolate reductase [Calditrichota bacterium]